MHATIEFWLSDLQRVEEGGYFQLIPRKRILQEMEIRSLSEVDGLLTSINRNYDHLDNAPKPGSTFVVGIFRVDDRISRSGYTTAYLDEHHAEPLQWHTLSGFVSNPAMPGFLSEETATWIEVGNLRRDLMMVMLG